MQPALAVRHNGPEAVTAELNDPVIRKALADRAGFKDIERLNDTRLTVTANDLSDSLVFDRPVWLRQSYKLKYPSLEARKLFPVRLQREIQNYLQLRLIGHTRAFATASVAKGRPASTTNTAKAIVTNVYKEIPESWLNVWEDEGKQVGYYLVDGELAWTFRTMGTFPWCQVADAQEFDPKLKEAFAIARKKAHENLAARGLKPRMGYRGEYHAELKKVLRVDHGIHWRAPTDLNMTTYD